MQEKLKKTSLHLENIAYLDTQSQLVDYASKKSIGRIMILILVIVIWCTPKVSDIFNVLAAKKQWRISTILEICHPVPIIENLAAW